MLSKYTFLAPNLIRVSRKGADYAHLITCASPLGFKFSSTYKMLSMYIVNLFGVFLSILFWHQNRARGGGADYSHLYDCPTPYPKSFGPSLDLLDFPLPP